MKRSDMLAIIKEMMDAYHPINLLDHKSMAKIILDSIEKAGMLPPSTNWWVDNCPDTMTWEEVNDYHQWEPEIPEGLTIEDYLSGVSSTVRGSSE